mgnify:CR=1 FL=1
MKQTRRSDETDITLTKPNTYYHMKFKDYGLHACKDNTLLLTRDELVTIKQLIDTALADSN